MAVATAIIDLPALEESRPEVTSAIMCYNTDHTVFTFMARVRFSKVTTVLPTVPGDEARPKYLQCRDIHTFDSSSILWICAFLPTLGSSGHQSLESRHF